MSRIVGAMTATASRVAAGGGQDEDVDAFGRILGECATHPERLVIGVGKHGHHSWRVHVAHLSLEDR